MRHVNALVADLAAEHGRVDLVGRRRTCAPAARDALVDRFEAYGVVGGAGARIHDDRGVLLVRYDETSGWLEPDVSSYRTRRTPRSSWTRAPAPPTTP